MSAVAVSDSGFNEAAPRSERKGDNGVGYQVVTVSFNEAAPRSERKAP